jgi:hypothetical protein
LIGRIVSVALALTAQTNIFFDYYRESQSAIEYLCITRALVKAGIGWAAGTRDSLVITGVTRLQQGVEKLIAT